MNKTKIDWCDMSWNPVTGCLHECEYCYARGIAHRFGVEPFSEKLLNPSQYRREKGFPILDTPVISESIIGSNKRVEPYPFKFEPTLHCYRLLEPNLKKEPQTIFVCSMADLFGEWVPDHWIEEVFKACEHATQHRYLFLTKNPGRYTDLFIKGMLPDGDNFWFGSTATTPDDPFWWSEAHNSFASIEPIQQPFEQPGEPVKKVDWIIIGAETGNRRGKVIPQREWIDAIVSDCRATDTPVFMKESLRSLMEEDFVQEFPWERSQ